MYDGSALWHQYSAGDRDSLVLVVHTTTIYRVGQHYHSCITHVGGGVVKGEKEWFI